MRTLLRREFVRRESVVRAGELALDTVTREIFAGGEPLSLTPREFEILEHLILEQGRWLSQEALMEHIWEADANPFSNVIRERLGYDPIQTKVGQGYRLDGERTR